MEVSRLLDRYYVLRLEPDVECDGGGEFLVGRPTPELPPEQRPAEGEAVLADERVALSALQRAGQHVAALQVREVGPKLAASSQRDGRKHLVRLPIRHGADHAVLGLGEPARERLIELLEGGRSGEGGGLRVQARHPLAQGRLAQCFDVGDLRRNARLHPKALESSQLRHLRGQRKGGEILT